MYESFCRCHVAIQSGDDVEFLVGPTNDRLEKVLLHMNIVNSCAHLYNYYILLLHIKLSTHIYTYIPYEIYFIVYSFVNLYMNLHVYVSK